MYSKGILCQCQGIFYASHEPTGTLFHHKNLTQVDLIHNICCLYVPQLNVIYNVISDWRRSNTIRETTQALFVLFPMLLPVANAGKNSTHLSTQVSRFSFTKFSKKLYLVRYCLFTLGTLRVRGQQIFRKSNPIPDLLFASY